MHRKIQVQQAMVAQKPVIIHLISGETYEGLCQEHEDPQLFQVLTEKGIITVPYWAIKRVIQPKSSSPAPLSD
ncbi:hypothetical protein Q5741_10975 [Paenibacillus sp. JX-17]|uniref:Uncharacterized protein n=1 Tax=Paenibacillus lacisoli TaxID=3064525 RepID=A0ABT9CCI0_9BACL|nr:hypothetical protein [Paenibacillus sp. JX-17]MDO7906937.1 hypothetical protein [Paenibacillus sp. JX-17]